MNNGKPITASSSLNKRDVMQAFRVFYEEKRTNDQTTHEYGLFPRAWLAHAAARAAPVATAATLVTFDAEFL